MLSPGDRVGRYAVERRVASGALGDVYRARDDALKRPVALKILHGTSERDRAEVRAVAALDHSKIVPLLDFFEYDGRLCLVQPWMRRGSLHALLGESGRLETAGTIRVGQDVAEALAHAHARGILHRDLKPSNVLSDREDSYRLSDFGAVGRLDPGTGTTRSGEIAGTPLWMSPEQVMGVRQGPASDIFGLGLLLFRCEFGHIPAEASGGVLDVLRQRVSAPISVPDSPLQPLIAQCLQLDPARRPSSATEISEWLSRYAAATASASVGTAGTATVQAPAPAAPPHTGTSHTWPAGAPRSARRMLPVAVGLAVVVLVLVLGLVAAGPLVDQGVAGPAVALGRFLLVLLGVLIAAFSIMVATRLRDRWSSPSPEAEQEAARILFQAESREDLSKSLIIEVEHLVRRLRSLDRNVLGMTIIGILREYEESDTSSDRQAALLNIVALMEKVQARLSPWHVRHREGITMGIAVVGCLTGLTSALGPFLA